MSTSVNKNRVTVASNIELLGIFVVFVVILFFLFPRDKIEKSVLKEIKNYDLSISYLKALSNTNPKNESFKLALLELYLKAGRDRELIELLKGLENNSYFKSKEQLNVYLYRLYIKENDTKGVVRIVNIISKNIKAYDKAIISGMVDDLIRLNLYSEVFKFSQLFMNNFTLTLQEKAKIMPDLYYLANNAKNKRYIGHYLVELMKIDKAKWAEATFYYFQDSKQFIEAIDILKYMLKKEYTVKRNENLAYLYMNTKQYEKATKEFERLTFTSNDKLKYFKNAVNAQMQENNSSKVYALIQKNEDLFLADEEGAEFIIKLYMGLERLKDATNFSKKMMKYKRSSQ